MQNRMIVGGYTLEVTSASIKGVAYGRGFYWLLEVRAKGVIEGDKLEPLLSSDRWFDPMRPVKHWQEIVRQNVSWLRAYDTSDGHARGLMYVYSHEVIGKGSIKFSSLHESKVRINWHGYAEINAECFENYDEVPFELDANASFVGVETRQLEEGTEQAAISQYVTGSRFYLKESRGSGFKLYYPEPN